MGSRFGVIRRMPIDWWYESETVGDFIGRKLEKHLFSAERIERDLGAAVTMFRQDIETNQAKMLAEIQAAVSSASILELNQLDAATFTRDVHEMLLSFAAETGRRDAALFVATEATSGVAGVVAEQMFVAILIRLVGVSGGSLGAGAAVGGGGGLVTGPVGATLGVAVGVIVALAVERWCTESVHGELRETVRRLIDQVEQAVLNGVTGEEMPDLQPRPGLKNLLNDSCDQLQRAYGEVFRQRLLGDAT
ncbi:hypothetical protein LOC68_11010 [Blastopirellula sp. JC732]|uniref:Uncharacterized protein n=1 Tax=Blastopirellula sediminis TaxID=2894196 RepID=A0A9X1SF98_9BACT|nr:hypothetical protein [Blastopirellula sediminis]MCC9608292.1 hypothetical protein [Blastopirellula sediminis]MCC9628930.1 hypothetical protein [Blastopirellula sediminis]